MPVLGPIPLARRQDGRRWKRVRDGWERRSCNGTLFRITPENGGWRLTEHGSMPRRVSGKPLVQSLFGSHEGTPTDVWAADTGDECKAMAQFIDDAARAKAEFLGRRHTMARQTHVPDLALHGIHHVGGAAIRLVDAAGVQVGRYDIALNGWKAAWLLGEVTFSGSIGLKAGLIGQGLGRAMYDFAEDFTGYRAAPHGSPGVVGRLNSFSESLWDKRAAHRPVPTLDPVADAAYRRSSFWLDMSPSSWLDIVIGMAAATSLDVGFATRDRLGGGPREVAAAWCLLPDGGCLAPFGRVARTDIVDRLLHRHGPVEVVRRADVETLVEAWRAPDLDRHPKLPEQVAYVLQRHLDRGITPGLIRESLEGVAPSRQAVPA